MHELHVQPQIFKTYIFQHQFYKKIGRYHQWVSAYLVKEQLTVQIPANMQHV